MKKLASTALLVVLCVVLVSGTTFGAATTKSLSTVYTVQNLGTAVANVTASYLKDTGSAWAADPGNSTFTVAAGSSKVIAQYADATLTNGRGSATLSSDQPIAAIVNMLARSQTPTSGSYTAFTQGASSFFMPFAFKKLNTSVGQINSQLIIMNVGAAATNVTVDLISGATGATTYSKSITNLAAGQSYYYDQSDESDANLPVGWYGSAKVTAAAGGSIAVVGNQFTGADGLLTYPGFEAGYTDWVVPLYVARLSNGFNAVIAVQNVSGGEIAAGGITVSFKPSSGAPFDISNPTPLANNATWSLNPRNNSAFPLNSVGSAKIHATGNVVAVVNQLVNEGTMSAPNALSFNAVRADLTGTKVVAPLAMSRLGNGYSTVFTVANLTNVAGTCNFTYKTDTSLLGSFNATYTANGVTLPAEGSIVHNHRLDGTGTHGLPANWFGAAEVICTQPVAGVINQLQAGGAGDPDLSYNAFTVAP